MILIINMYIYGILIFAILIILLTYINIYNFKNRSESLSISKLLWETSELLTNNIRNYIVTGQKKYLENYWKIANARQSNFPWDKSFKDEHSFFVKIKDQQSIQDLWKKVRFTKKEIEVFKEAYDISYSLMWKEIQSINWISGRFDGTKDKEGNSDTGTAKKIFDSSSLKEFIEFKTKGKQQVQRAIDNLFSDEYFNSKNKIKNLCLQGTNYVNRRTLQKSNYSTFILYIILMLNCFYIIFVILKFSKLK